MLRGVTLAQQIAIAFQGVFQCCRVGVLRSKTVRRAENTGSALDCQHGAKACGMFQAAAGIAAAVQIQYHALAPLILGDDPGTTEAVKGMLFHQYLVTVLCFHKLAHFVLAFAYGIQGTAIEDGL